MIVEKKTKFKYLANPTKIRNLNIHKLIDILNNEKYISSLSADSVSEFIAKDTYIIPYNIICKFGYLKLTDDMFKK